MGVFYSLGAQVQTSLHRHYRANHFQRPAKIHFDPDPSIAHRYKKQGQSVAIPRSRETVKAYKGIIHVPQANRKGSVSRMEVQGVENHTHNSGKNDPTAGSAVLSTTS